MEFLAGAEYSMDVILSTPAKKSHFCFHGTVCNEKEMLTRSEFDQFKHSLLYVYMTQLQDKDQLDVEHAVVAPETTAQVL